MNPIRQIYEDAPAFIPVPLEFRHHRVEVTLWPLESEMPSTDLLPPVSPANRKDDAQDQDQVTHAVGAMEHIRGLEAAQHDAMQRMWDNDSD